MKNENIISRRQFISTTGLLAAATALPSAVFAKKTKEGIPESKPKLKPKLKKKVLGKTGLEISEISLGTGSGQDPNIIKFAINQGINFIHTSVNYAGGKAIGNVAEAIKGRQKDVVLGLKITWQPDDDKAMDAALKKLGVDSVDIAFFNIHNPKEIKDKRYKEGAARWKKAGKFKYIGLTTHTAMKECMEEALNQGFYDALMPAYNLTMAEECKEVFSRAKKDNLGIILMKSQKNIKQDDYVQAVSKYLQDPAITTINKTLNSFAQIKTLIEAANTPLPKKEDKKIEKKLEVAMIGHCTMCGKCTEACPNNLPVSDLVRCSDYYIDSAGSYVEFKDVFSNLSKVQMPSECKDCGKCEKVCKFNVPIRHHLHRLDIAWKSIKEIAV